MGLQSWWRSSKKTEMTSFSLCSQGLYTYNYLCSTVCWDMFDHTASVWMHAKKLCTAIKEHLFSGWKGPFTHVCPEKKNLHKSLISKIWQLTNSLQSIWGKGQVGQETKVPQMSTMFSHQNSKQKKPLELAMELAFYQTRCRLAVLRKLHNTMQDLVCGDSKKSCTAWGSSANWNMLN